MRLFDVVIHDTVRTDYTLDTQKGVGGSEFAVIRLANSLRDKGYSVHLQHADETKVCKALIVQRYSDFPHMKSDTRVRWLHDLPHYGDYETYGGTNVCQTEYQAGLFRPYCKDPVVVIPPMLPNEVYEIDRPPRRPGSYLFASATLKGWDATYEKWKQLRQPGDTLRVMNCGYSKLEQAPDETVQLLPYLGDTELANVIAASSGIFYVNRHPETFGATVAMAEALGTPVYLWTDSGNLWYKADDPDLRFANRESHRISDVLPIWLAQLGLA